MNNVIHKIFSEVSGTYELVNRVLTFGLDSGWRKKAARAAAAGGGERWLDVCSGTGDMALNLARLAPNQTRIFAADFSKEMMSRAVSKPEARRILFTLADVTALPFPDNTFDLVTISFATRNLNKNRAALTGCFREFHRVLKPGGRFVNLETSQPELKLIKTLMHTYVKLAVKPIGYFFSGSRAGYGYLSHTIPRFYRPDELAGILHEAGFDTVTFTRLFFGASAIHTAYKAKNDRGRSGA